MVSPAMSFSVIVVKKRTFPTPPMVLQTVMVIQTGTREMPGTFLCTGQYLKQNRPVLPLNPILGRLIQNTSWRPAWSTLRLLLHQMIEPLQVLEVPYDVDKIFEIYRSKKKRTDLGILCNNKFTPFARNIFILCDFDCNL